MFKNNVGSVVRAIRGLVGIALLAGYFMGAVMGIWAWLALMVGVVMLATAVLGWCPPYSLLGINTCSVKKA